MGHRMNSEIQAQDRVHHAKSPDCQFPDEAVRSSIGLCLSLKKIFKDRVRLGDWDPTGAEEERVN
ncbi:hypothetical protein MGYG_06358 [Nannizzia gypsea CBS 118893]|uniref:Uncharacterized protein n=1 Tax=Arthroderma gypseum (strain ATCC MYA-4604 / CBS 118893) TaxID=535722 RepID=E4UZ30_ARTGP|nr:hypothetical protein MGYG_06358 [Nannizzia gypsea CBS 118893]EFR03360.1 hypothetical protein MGYG_06358 [Nannizzia gypsea CBS 118893]